MHYIFIGYASKCDQLSQGLSVVAVSFSLFVIYLFCGYVHLRRHNCSAVAILP